MAGRSSDRASVPIAPEASDSSAGPPQCAWCGWRGAVLFPMEGELQACIVCRATVLNAPPGLR
eukprot:14367830-Alexandrium_andersonii.AAC.1